MYIDHHLPQLRLDPLPFLPHLVGQFPQAGLRHGAPGGAAEVEGGAGGAEKGAADVENVVGVEGGGEDIVLGLAEREEEAVKRGGGVSVRKLRCQATVLGGGNVI